MKNKSKTRNDNSFQKHKMYKNMKDNSKDKYSEEEFENVSDSNNDNLEEAPVDETESNTDFAESASEPDEIDTLREEVEKQKKEYMFLMAEFDNFRKRTLKEKSELIKNAGEQVLKGLLPIVDDFERGLKAAEDSDDVSGLKEGMQLIYNKLVKYLASNGVKEMNPEDKDFDADRHEAISVVPAPSDDLKGKILDTIEKGYMLNDKVLRHAKVVVGQ